MKVMDLGNNRKEKPPKQKGKLYIWCTNDPRARTRTNFTSGRNSFLYSGMQGKGSLNPMEL